MHYTRNIVKNFRIASNTMLSYEYWAIYILYILF